MINEKDIPVLYQKLKSHIARDFRIPVIPSTTTTVISGGGSGGGSGATSFSGLSGTIADAQAPQFLLRNGARSLTGNLAVDAGITIDGVDLSVHAADPNAHHARQHSMLSVTDHIYSGGNALDLFGLSATSTLGLITPSANPGAASAVLKSSGAGNLALTSLTTPLLNTSSGDMVISPASGKLGIMESAPASRVEIRQSSTGTGFGGTDGTGALRISFATGYGIGIDTWDGSSPRWGILSFVGDTPTVMMEGRYSSADVVFNATGGSILVGTTTNAGYKLDVSGTARVSTSLTTPLVTTVGSGIDLTLASADDILLDPASNLVKLTSNVNFQSDNYASQTTGLRVTWDGQGDFRYIYTDELHAKAFIADLEQALAGGQIICKSVSVLHADFTAPAAGGTALLVMKDLPSATGMAVFVNGDYVRIRTFTRAGGGLSITDCWGTVVLDTSYGVSGFDSATKSQRYTFTRSTAPNAGAMTAGTVVYADAIILDYGTTGNGFYEVNAIDGLNAANSPYAQIVTWSGHPRSQTVRARLGNLYGIWSVSGEYGLYAGDGTADTNQYLRISSSGVRLNNVPLTLYSSGVQTVNIDSAGTNIWIGPNSTDKRLSWDGTTLNVSGQITVTGGNAAKIDFSNITATLDALGDGSTYKRTTANEKTGAGRAFTAINSSNNLVTSVIPASAITPAGAGLYLGSNYLGYYSGSAWKTYIDSSGNLMLAGNTAGNYLQWAAASNKLQGVGSSVEQWYADATTGRIRAGQDSVQLGYYGLDVLGYTAADPNPTSNIQSVSFWDALSSANGSNRPASRVWGVAGGSNNWYGIQIDAFHPTQYSSTYPSLYMTVGVNTPYTRWFVLNNLDQIVFGGTTIAVNGLLTVSQTATLHHLANAAASTYDIGTVGTPWRNLYVDTIVAGTITGSVALGGQTWQYDTGDMFIKSNSASARTLYVSNPGAGTMGLDVEGNINAGGNITVTGLVDGVDIAAFKTAYDAFTPTALLASGTVTGATSQAQVFTNGITSNAKITTSRSADAAVRFDVTTVTSNARNWAWVASHFNYGDFVLMESNAQGGDPIAAGTARMSFSYTGDFAVGTSSAQLGDGTYASSATFQSASANGAFLVLRKPDTTNYLQGLYIQDKANNAGWMFGVEPGGLATIGYGSGASETAAVTAARNATFFRISTTGLIGIGVSTATALLHVGASTTGRASLRIASGTAPTSPNGGDIWYGTGGYNFIDQLSISPGSALPPFVLNANAQGQTVVGLQADKLNKQVIAGNGLVTGGTLTADVTLTLGTPSTLTVSTTNSVSSGTHSHAITSSSNPGAAASLLATASDGSLTLGTTMFQLDNTAKTIGFGVTPDGAASYDFKALATADHTVRIKQLASQTGRLWRIEDTGAQELIVLDSVGNLQSGNPGFVSGLTGWQITPAGNAEFNNGVFRGALHASVFVVDEFHASGGTLFVSPAGKLLNNWTINTTTGAEAVRDIRTTSASGSGSQLDIRTTSGTGSGTQLTTRNVTNTLDMEDPPSGHAIIFTSGQILRIKSMGQLTGSLNLYDVWLRVLYVEDMTTYYRYDVQVTSGGSHGAIIPAGVAVTDYGARGEGRMLLTSDLAYAPYQDIFITGDTPWTGDVQPVVRIGRLDGVGLPGISGVTQYGIVMGSDLSDANSPYVVASDLQLALHKVDLSNYSANGNQTVSLTSTGVFKLGIDVTNSTQTALDFNPVTGVFTIGNASYPAAVNVIGSITITGGSGYANITDKPTSLSGINSTEGTKLTGIETGATLGAAWGTNLTGRPTELTDGRITAGLNSSGSLITKVLPGSNIGTPAGSGLYLGADKLGYYSGSAWTLYFDNTGKMGLGGTSGARLGWDGTDLFGTNGTTVQWYARASTGKLYAGGGSVWIDANGIGLAQGTGLDSSLTFYSGATEVSRIWSWANLLTVLAEAPTTGATAQARLMAIDAGLGGAQAKVDAVVDSSGNTKIYLQADDVRIGGTTNHVMGIRTTS